MYTLCRNDIVFSMDIFQEVYYIKYKAIKVNNKVVKKIAPKGKLYNQYTNLIKGLLTGGLRRSYRISSSDIHDSISTLDGNFTPCTI